MEGAEDCGECVVCKYMKAYVDFKAYKNALAKRLCEESHGKEVEEVRKICDEGMAELEVEHKKLRVLQDAVEKLLQLVSGKTPEQQE